MSRYSLAQLSDTNLLSSSDVLAVRIETDTADFLARIAEIDDRKLYLEHAYPSMFAFCMGRWRLSEDAVAKRIQAARTARKFPAIFVALAEGRLHLSAVVMLAPHLNEANAGDLMAAATHKSKAEIERMLANRFPRPDLPTRLRALPSVSVAPSTMEQARGDAAGEPAPEDVHQHAPGHVGGGVFSAGPPSGEHRPGPVAGELVSAVAHQHAPGHVEVESPMTAVTHSTAKRPRLTPLAPGRFGLQVTIHQRTRDKLRHAQNLLSHAVSPGDVAEVLDRALDALIAQLEKRKFAATSKPRPACASSDRSRNPRQIPAHVKRAVWNRDGGQCTFVSETGRRCQARSLLEFDHMDEVARGGQASVSRIRLRCRAHNQFEAERSFGRGFMDRKRSEAAEAREADARAGP